MDLEAEAERKRSFKERRQKVYGGSGAHGPQRRLMNVLGD